MQGTAQHSTAQPDHLPIVPILLPCFTFPPLLDHPAQVFDYENNGSHKFIGECQTSLAQLRAAMTSGTTLPLVNPAKVLQNPKPQLRNTGRPCVVHIHTYHVAFSLRLRSVYLLLVNYKGAAPPGPWPLGIPYCCT